MVQQDCGPLIRVREKLNNEDEIKSKYEKAMEVASHGTSRLDDLIEAAKDYVNTWKGEGDFLESGCVEFFPPGKPTNGPRLDKRSILRAIANGTVQGGPTADTLIIAALVLALPSFDP